MRADEYQRHDLIGLADLVRRRQVSAGEVVEAALARMAAVNPRINAVTLDLSEAARAAAAGPLSGPLAGAPYLVKEHAALVAGTPTTLGSRVFRDVVQPADSALVSALRGAGLLIIGKTATPELGMKPVTEPRLTGPTRNPWDLERTPGGSSGGASAAVAAGITPAAHGSDAGGSIRSPAACTGLFGLKPSRGRSSFAPRNEGGGGTHTQHAITRSVRDSALLLDIICRPQPGDPYWLAPPARPYLEEVGRPPGALRIAFSPGAVRGEGLSDLAREAVREATSLCEALGHHLEEVRLPGEFPSLAAARVTAANVAATLDAEAERRGRAIGEDEVEPMTFETYQAGRAIVAGDYIRCLQAVHAYARGIAAFLEPYDVLLDATLGCEPLRIGELDDVALDRAAYVSRVLGFVPNTQVANLTGQPAMSVPLAWSPSGLPLGVQFTARAGDEATLFRLAGQLEAARPWADRRPPDFP